MSVPSRKVPLPIKDAYTTKIDRYSDHRGFLEEVYHQDKDDRRMFLQVVLSESKKNTLRGIHCSAYGKMVTCVQGKITDFLIDLRKTSPTYMQWKGVELSPTSQSSIYIPAYCGHAFFAHEDDTRVLYQQEGTYNPPLDIEVNPFCPDANIMWPLGRDRASYEMSEKDAAAPFLKDLQDRLDVNAEKYRVHNVQSPLFNDKKPFTAEERKKFNRRLETGIDGAFVIKVDRYKDHRGFLEEVYHSLKDQRVTIRQIVQSESKKDTLRGIHCSPYGKMVTCVSGSATDYIIDLRKSSPTYGKWKAVEISSTSQTSVYVPPFCGHAFYAKEDGTRIMYMQEGTYNQAGDCEVNLFDKELNVEWANGSDPSKYVISEKDLGNPTLEAQQPKLIANDEKRTGQADYLVLGPNGFFGQHVTKVLDNLGLKYNTSRVRLHDGVGIGAELDKFKPKYVIVAAGIAGVPNIDWCETHRPETIAGNVAGQINVAQQCLERHIHCTLFGTGCLYQYDDAHPPASGKGFTEEDKPNFHGNYYGDMRILLEDLVKEYPNVLSLRVIFPMADDFRGKSLNGKLIKFPKITSVPQSFTVIDDLWPLIPEMGKRNLTGIYNFANPGFADNKVILEAYKKHIKPEHSWEDIKGEAINAKRSFCHLDVTKLTTEFPEIPEIHQAIENLMLRFKENEAKAE